MDKYADLIDTLACVLFAMVCMAGCGYLFIMLKTAWWPVFVV